MNHHVPHMLTRKKENLKKNLKTPKKTLFFLTKWDRDKKIKRKKEGCNI